MCDINEYVSGAEASKILNLHQKTLRHYAATGKIKFIRSNGTNGKRLYNVNDYLGIQQHKVKKNNMKICYCRVSSNGQSDDLKRQIDYMRKKYPNHVIISDIGSGINFKRPGLVKLIDYAVKGELKEVVLNYKDRLCRIGFDMIEHIFSTYSNTNIIIEHENEDETPEMEIANDILQIMTVFVAKNNGLRSHNNISKTNKK